MKHLCVFFVIMIVCTAYVNAAGTADDVGKQVGKRLGNTVAKKVAKEAAEGLGKRADDAVKFAVRHAPDWQKIVTFKLDNAAHLAARYGDNVAKLSLKNGDNIITDFSKTHARILGQTTKTVSSVADDTAAIVIKNTDDLVKNGLNAGGYFGELKGAFKKAGQPGTLTAHHIPSQSAIKGANLWDGDIGKAPAIVMDAADHVKTASFGYSESARNFRAAQEELIKNGRFADALQMDIDDLTSKGLYKKYKTGIDQMMTYVKNLEAQGQL